MRSWGSLLAAGMTGRATAGLPLETVLVIGLPADPVVRGGGWRNVPLPEPFLLALAVGVWLDRRRPWVLPGSRSVQRLAGWPLTVGGAYLIERAWTATLRVHLERPELLVTGGPYAVSRNPMYVGWALLHLGVGVGRGSGWIIAVFPAAAAQVHREVRREEGMLAAAFGADFRRYRATVPRYLPWRLRRPGRR